MVVIIFGHCYMLNLLLRGQVLIAALSVLRMLCMKIVSDSSAVHASPPKHMTQKKVLHLLSNGRLWESEISKPYWADSKPFRCQICCPFFEACNFSSWCKSRREIILCSDSSNVLPFLKKFILKYEVMKNLKWSKGDRPRNPTSPILCKFSAMWCSCWIFRLRNIMSSSAPKIYFAVCDKIFNWYINANQEANESPSRVLSMCRCFTMSDCVVRILVKTRFAVQRVTLLINAAENGKPCQYYWKRLPLAFLSLRFMWKTRSNVKTFAWMRGQLKGWKKENRACTLPVHSCTLSESDVWEGTAFWGLFLSAACIPYCVSINMKLYILSVFWRHLMIQKKI